jgi:hypothetical protein
MTDAMTTKKPKKQKAPPPFPVELIDQLLAQVQNKDAESILGESGLAGQLKKMLAERMLAAELSHHLASCNWTSHVTGSPASSRNWWPSTSGACPVSTIT